MNTLKIISVVIFITILSACTKDFQSSNWGDSIEEVKLTENEQQWYQSVSPDSTQSAAYYEGQFENLPAIIFYAFSNNELIWGKYVFTQEHSDHAQYYTDYTIINSVLQKKLGTVDANYIFSTDIEKQTPAQWGETIYQGELLVQTNWDKKRTKVMHAIFGENHEVTHSIEYNSIPSNK